MSIELMEQIVRNGSFSGHDRKHRKKVRRRVRAIKMRFGL